MNGFGGMADPLVSVQMITYNHASYIAKAIEGVLAQRVSFPIELVIGEDCSIDGTRDIVLAYQSNHPDVIRVITSDTNVGMKRNNYRTMKACRGKYVAFCEGDDYWHHTGKLQQQADYMERHPDCGLIFSDYDVYHVSSRRFTRDFLKHQEWTMPKSPDIWDFFCRRFAIILTCTVMTRRTLSWQIMDSDPFLHQSAHFLMGDVQHWLETATRARVHYIPESLATYTQTEESATRSKDITRILRFAVSNAEVLIYLSNKYNLPSSVRNTYEASWCDASLRLAFHTRNAELAEEVRKKKKAFTHTQLLRYYAAKHLALYYPFRFAASFRNVLWSAYKEWL
jgi:glycosyltransferase involved in cell wall biosynthesis